MKCIQPVLYSIMRIKQRAKSSKTIYKPVWTFSFYTGYALSQGPYSDQTNSLSLF